MELKEAILNRRSIRKFQKRDIPPAQVEELLRLASWAPSANNSQMWFFYAVHSPEVREKIAKAIENQLHEILSWQNRLRRKFLGWAGMPNISERLPG